MKTLNFKKINNKKGFTLLFAVLVAIMVLAVGTSIINISLKQVILSGAGRESQFAFYAANTGMECALYWDLNGIVVNDAGQAFYVFPTNEDDAIRNDLEEVTCAEHVLAGGDPLYGQTYTFTATDGWQFTADADSSETTFRIAISNTVPDTDNILYCAEINVQKEKVDDSGTVVTTITSQGLNTCDPENDARAVQRGLELQYRS